MKKQLFILIVMAVIAANFSAYAQDCTPGALAPVAGVPYNYSVTIGGQGYNGTGDYTWYVTTNVDLLSGTGVVPNDGTMFQSVTGYGVPTANFNPLTLTWTAAATTGAQTFYLVVKYSQANSTATPSCTAMNMKVWKIKPINKFLLAASTFNGTNGQDGVYCAEGVSGAVVTPGDSPTVTYTYGVNTIYAKVVAKNYAGAWTPSFRIEGKRGNQSITSVSWDTSPTGTYSNATTAQNDTVFLAIGDATAAYDGSLPIYVKIVVTNNNYENLTDGIFKIGVDGVIPNTGGLSDVLSEDDCSQEVPFGKFVNLTVKARPTINPGATGTFIQQTP